MPFWLHFIQFYEIIDGLTAERLLAIEGCLGVRTRADVLHAVFRIEPEECREMLRQKMGIDDARDHVVIARLMHEKEADLEPDGVGTILVSKEPFSKKDINEIEKICSELGFQVVYSSDTSLDPVIDKIISF